MQGRFRRIAGPALGAALVALAPGAARAASGAVDTPSALLLFSLRSTAPAVREIESAFRGVLETGYGSPVDLHVEYLDLPDTGDVPVRGDARRSPPGEVRGTEDPASW